MEHRQLRVGIDIGSTTAKVVALDQGGELVFSEYRRHHADTLLTLQSIIQEASQALGDIHVDLFITGSAGMGISEKYRLPFIQEVVASAEVVRQLYPEVKTLIDIGGEDAKMIFFDEDGTPDIRMNGSCAGGTGAFIDEMAVLLNIPVSELNGLAEKFTTIYPIASRCGVFAKTDMQNLLSREIAWEDIAASVFNAVVLQTLATLSRGNTPSSVVLFSGGPLTFLPALKNAFMRVMELDQGDVLKAENSELLPAIGAALATSADKQAVKLTELSELLATPPPQNQNGTHRLNALFENELELGQWKEKRAQSKVKKANRAVLDGEQYFLGVDSGSTTTKVVLVDEQGEIAFDYYCNNNGAPINAVREGLEKIQQRFASKDAPPKISRSVVTGYGEDLIRAAFGFDEGMVETLAHFRAAKEFDGEVSFILDIGGQDMKAIFVKDGRIQNIEINEACSSGCGTFIEAFSKSMKYSVSDFAQLACTSQSPCDLGSRCTVFMNSKVKQSLREGAKVEDISAGLAYSVIKNALHKVLKITDPAVLGDHIIVQGGTFRNPAVHKAFENLLGKKVICPDTPELMGAYGAALTAQDAHLGGQLSENYFVGFDRLESAGEYEKKHIRCRGCENNCSVTKLIFQNKNIFYTGNRCEKIYSNSGARQRKGTSLPDLKYELLFERECEPDEPAHLTVGIPRALNLYENYPFWNTLFVESGIKVQLSEPSTNELCDKGVGTIMSENICFPAKLTHGHIINLIDAGVDRIFFPMVFYEKREFSNTANCFNCPVISGYPDVIRSAIDPEGKSNIPLDMPAINFNDQRLLEKACTRYLKGLGIKTKTIKRAIAKAVDAQTQFKAQVRALGAEILKKARDEERPVILLMTRPYHIDPMINHKVPETLINFGVDVITEDAVPKQPDQTVDGGYASTQWTYSNRFFHAAHWAGQQEGIETVQLNSFGCGPDASVVDNMRSILGEYKKGHTVIRIDEIKSTGSTKLRLRSMIELMKKNGNPAAGVREIEKPIRLFQESDRERTIIIPHFSLFCSPPFMGPIMESGYKVELLPPPDRESVQEGLKYTNNDICYPGIVVIGDLIKRLKSGEYDLDEVAIGFWETGGQCRATSYLSLLKRALISSGYEQVPVIVISTGTKTQHEQPGFEMGAKEFLSKAALGIIFSDEISNMYHATAIREINKGEALETANKYMELLKNDRLPVERENLLETLEEAVADFNRIESHDRQYPTVGLVGEIYLKYSTFGNHQVAEWLMEQGIEVIIPPLAEFFSHWFVSMREGLKSNLRKPDMLLLLSFWIDKQVQRYLENVDEIMKGFKHYRPGHSIYHLAEQAEEIVELTHQYGEGWLIAGEIGAFVSDGVENVLCLQPFGCIANHVVAKGVGTRIKAKHPRINLLFLDIDAGTSEVNFFNRLHFFVDRTKSRHENNHAPVVVEGY